MNTILKLIEKDLDQLKKYLKIAKINYELSDVTCAYYPFYSFKENGFIYCPKQFSSVRIEKIKKILSKKIKTTINCTVSEFCYKGIEKILFNSDKINEVYYVKKKSLSIPLYNGFAILTIFSQIDQSQFPDVKEYDNKCVNNQVIMQDKFFDFIMKKISDETGWTICVNFNVNENPGEKMSDMIKTITNTLEHLCSQEDFSK